MANKVEELLKKLESGPKWWGMENGEWKQFTIPNGAARWDLMKMATFKPKHNNK